MGRELVAGDAALGAHLPGQVHEAGGLEPLDLVRREAHAHAVPAHLRDVPRERRQLHEHVGLVGVHDELAPGAPRRAEARDEAVEVLPRGGDGEELLRRRLGQLEQPLLDVGLAAQAVRAAGGAQRGALAEQPVGAAHALVGEQVLEAEAGASVGAQVAGVEQALSVGLDEQGARVRRSVVHRDRRHGEAADRRGRRSSRDRPRLGPAGRAAATRPPAAPAGPPAAAAPGRTRARRRAWPSSPRCRTPGSPGARGARGRSGRRARA